MLYIEDDVYEHQGKFSNAKFILALNAYHGHSEMGIQNTYEILKSPLKLFKDEKNKTTDDHTWLWSHTPGQCID